MKKLSVKWLAGTDANGEPVFKRQTLKVEDSVDVTKANAIAQILDRYTNYTIDSVQLISYENVI
ncbi:hypothetical protein SU69_05500 [Thermosipho melanesiensis]|uniref:DUF1659 domain-containing protein n=2 Tax=Thermosipho melanesiensis TaxID=46541 RepID=A6LLY6_THEM4|nr:hypothetical protein [Thermosipho melanesiensis]ABR30937.1 hypothetical protein Tmel_1077 [Thermosipho melanesiensis BI429]APT74050.1 hypothetical protein BW47_05760 [Thermosipho melanesiensis]OOC35981.1 hypothetical protein SU68_05560 [Thermosipho melanesiensis]OOC38120.1 hypothetical protein SU69_05500 [Thermosipho melanesiensis]OOC38249.1 hypothetical protein SU70_05510 [Thermosipho melanesiensis]